MRVCEPLCIKTDILKQAQQGNVASDAIKQIRRLGTFYLETAFQYNIFKYGLSLDIQGQKV